MRQLNQLRLEKDRGYGYEGYLGQGQTVSLTRSTQKILKGRLTLLKMNDILFTSPEILEISAATKHNKS